MSFIGGAPVREAPSRRREDSPEVSRQSSGHRGEGSEGQDRRPRQEEVPRAVGPDCWPGRWCNKFFNLPYAPLKIGIDFRS